METMEQVEQNTCADIKQVQPQEYTHRAVP